MDSIISMLDDLTDIDEFTTIIDMGSTKEIIVKKIFLQVLERILLQLTQ